MKFSPAFWLDVFSPFIPKPSTAASPKPDTPVSPPPDGASQLSDFSALVCSPAVQTSPLQRWEYQDTSGKWHSYPAEVSAALRTEEVHVYTASNGKTYEITVMPDRQKAIQTNTSSKVSRKARCVIPGDGSGNLESLPTQEAQPSLPTQEGQPSRSETLESASPGEVEEIPQLTNANPPACSSPLGETQSPAQTKLDVIVDDDKAIPNIEAMSEGLNCSRASASSDQAPAILGFENTQHAGLSNSAGATVAETTSSPSPSLQTSERAAVATPELAAGSLSTFSDSEQHIADESEAMASTKTHIAFAADIDRLDSAPPPIARDGSFTTGAGGQYSGFFSLNVMDIVKRWSGRSSRRSSASFRRGGTRTMSYGSPSMYAQGSSETSSCDDQARSPEASATGVPQMNG